jgi:hypothetical protein
LERSISGGSEITTTIRCLSRSGQTDEQIAALLTAQGHRTPHGGAFYADAVSKLRRTNGILRFPKCSRPPRIPGYLTIAQVAEKLKITKFRIYNHIARGTIAVKKKEGITYYLFPDKLDTLTQLRQLLDGKIDKVAF